MIGWLTVVLRLDFDLGCSRGEAEEQGPQNRQNHIEHNGANFGRRY
jgi:hypothetical protein